MQSFGDMSNSDAFPWLGRTYPNLDDLERSLEALGGVLTQADIGDEALFVVGENDIPPVVILPVGVGVLRKTWLLAHELGHLVQHAGPRGDLLRGKDENQASRWAARALIPERAIRRHQNASMDAFIAALSAHYQDLPLEDCPERRLAAEIALVRLGAMKEVG